LGCVRSRVRISPSRPISPLTSTTYEPLRNSGSLFVWGHLWRKSLIARGTSHLEIAGRRRNGEKLKSPDWLVSPGEPTSRVGKVLSFGNSDVRSSVRSSRSFWVSTKPVPGVLICVADSLTGHSPRQEGARWLFSVEPNLDWMTVAFHDTFKAEDLVPLWKEKTITSKAPYSSSVTTSSSFWRISFIVTVIAVAYSNGGARIFLHEYLLTTRSYNLPGSVFR
jgi:hypothetical protein